jgi:cell division protein FtsW
VNMAAKSLAPNDQVNFPLDPMMCVLVAGLLGLGLIMVSSATVEMSARTYGSPWYLLTRHLIYVVISLAGAIAAISIPIRVWQKLDITLLVLGFALLIAVLIPGIGREVNGSVRWISLGFFTIQGSEFLKLFVVIYIAGYLARRNGLVGAPLSGFAKPIGIVLALVTLLMIQPDFGACVVIMCAVLGVIFLAGAPLKHFMPLVAGCVIAAVFLVLLQPYRLARLTAFTDPWKHQFDGGYQLTQALIAFGRGDLFGLGLGNSIQKLFFLPEAHTDFLFSILSEELGVIAAALVVSAFCALVLRALWIGHKAQSLGLAFHAYVAFGAGLMLGIQACINLGVNLGLLPTKGLTLPLMSYGGNSLIVSCFMIGLVLRIGYEIGEQSARPVRRRSHGS